VPRHGIFIYSTYCIEEESGDAAGNRAMLIRDGDGDRLFWEWSDGPMEGPIQARKLSISDKSAGIKFSVDTGSEDTVDSSGKSIGKNPANIESFSGTISAQALHINNSTLPRVVNFARKTQICRPTK